MVDNNSGSDVVATLDVVTGLGASVLAQRQIRRSDFAAANQWQTFTLQFDNPCFGQTEARIWWFGNTSMKFSQLTITPLSVSTPGVQWLVTDRLGTPRMVLDQTGTLGGISRHDYLPFGEEVYAGIGARTITQGYTGDSTRQHFTGYEMDAETGLNFAQARYQSPVQGRFTSVDPLGASADILNPQSFNRYSYVLNNPVNATDPTGMMTMIDASMGWSVVSAMWYGPDPRFGGPETGRSIIANRIAAQESGIRDLMKARSLNEALRSGKITPDEARRIVKEDPNLAIEESGAPSIIFTNVKVISPPGGQTKETSGSGALGAVTLNMEKELGENADKVKDFQLQVNFIVPEDFDSIYDKTSGVMQRKNSRWEIVGDSPITIEGMRGNVKITMKQKNNEGESIAGTVVIAGRLRNGDSVSGTLRIRIVTSSREGPPSQRDKP